MSGVVLAAGLALGATALGGIGVAVARRRRTQAGVLLYGRTNAQLQLVAQALGAEYVPPERGRRLREFATVRGRARGCVFEIAVEALGGSGPVGSYVTVVDVLHYGARDRVTLATPGLTPPAIDPDALVGALERLLDRVAAGS